MKSILRNIWEALVSPETERGFVRLILIMLATTALIATVTGDGSTVMFALAIVVAVAGTIVIGAFAVILGLVSVFLVCVTVAGVTYLVCSAITGMWEAFLSHLRQKKAMDSFSEFMKSFPRIRI